ncbi:putative SOS response-associated peptidase YedK [Ulvibacter sp. MAR_2010_11]|uniref:SOS response-associated peptidase n=1 Tax=Ulvibacter sp. MAR_2010_11 TaxID=1250229 RepID=UPI000C2B9C5D|nr:SOS response-associated peptidase [Ulvibacter sp. MAR_2010_11]PKA84417.1 putative SOS response-associated peptidase YedK [Ulvibacter sp. MAR_2010_11]
MCYDIKASLEAQLNRARRNNDLQAIAEIMEKLVPLTDLPIYHTSGFSHPELLIYTDRSPDFPEVATWGLVPEWIRDSEQQKKIWNNTLNARGETIFEKPAFRTSAKHHRCIVYIDGFYEHHHYDGKTYPFYIFQKSGKPMALAGLWSEWHDEETGGTLTTFSIVTTTGNPMMGKIHNNLKLKEPRMPVILPEAMEDPWLQPVQDELAIQSIKNLIQELPEDELKAYTVARLRGKEYLGNVEEISEKVEYAELPEL